MYLLHSKMFYQYLLNNILQLYLTGLLMAHIMHTLF